MKNFIIILLVKSFIFVVSSLSAQSNLYTGLKYGQLNVDRSTVDGYDLDNFVPTESPFIDIFIGFNLTSNFFGEFGYVKSDKETITGSQTVGGITITGTNISQEFYGFRAGTGYNFQLTDSLKVKPFLNHYRVDVESSGTFVASSGSATATASISGTDSETFTEVGIGISFMIKNIDLGASYAKSISQLDEVDDLDVIGLSLSYNF